MVDAIPVLLTCYPGNASTRLPSASSDHAAGIQPLPYRASFIGKRKSSTSLSHHYVAMTTSLADEKTDLSNPASGPTLETIKLPRGGVVACTSIGPVQLGMPPETIKDSMKLGIPVPRHYIVPSEPFTKTLGANMGVNVAEFEFPAYCNFFFKRQCVNLIVASEDVETRIRQVFQETLFGPVELDLRNDFPQSTPPDQFPDLRKELEYFRKFGDTLITLDMLLTFTHFDENGEARISQLGGANDIPPIIIRKGDDCFTIVDGAHGSVTLADAVDLPPPPSVSMPHLEPFYPPAFGVTVLGNSHGFDPNGKTSGYVLWINHRGIMIDPPPFTSSILSANNIPALMIDGVILTHCHADHDAGTFQKILQEGRVALITTNTIYRSFLRKYSALSGFEPSFLERVLDHRLVRINDVTQIRGAEFRFFYSLHSIPCVGFEVTYGDKKIAFSGDHLNDVDRILQLESEGVLSAARAQELLNFPWHCDVILHEAGVPPIHTPLKTLMALDETIRQKVYVVHTAAKDLPENCGLRGAPEGVHNTIKLDVPRLPENAGALEILDLVRKVDLFGELTLNHAYEILQMARKVEYSKGEIVSKTGGVGDTFYIIIVGEAQAVHSKENHDSAASPEPATPKPLARGRDSCTRRRLSMLSLAKQYRPGDYFDLQSLLTPNWVLPYDMIASTKLSLLEFNALDFNWFLRRTSSFERIQQLAQSRLYFSYDIVESNQVFRRLTEAQRTALEIILRPRDVTEGQVLWNIGDRCSSAVIVDKGHFLLKIAPLTGPTSGTSPTRNLSGELDDTSRGFLCAALDQMRVKTPYDEGHSSDAGAGTRLRSHRARDARSSTADSTSDGADTDASTSGHAAEAPAAARGRPGRRRGAGYARKTAEEPRRSARELRRGDERHSSRSGDEELDEELDEEQDEGDADRKRSLSNVSNTSSTSASSLASEPLTEEQRRARLDQHVAELEQKRKMVEDGTLAEFCRRVAAFKEERNRLLQTAELHKNLQLKNGQDLYNFDVQRALHLWENERKVLKEELLAKTDAVMEKLQAEMKALSEPSAKVTEVTKKAEQTPGDPEADKPAVFVAVVNAGKDGDKKAGEPEQEEGEVSEPLATTKDVPLGKRRKMDTTAPTDPVEMSRLLPAEAVRLPFDDLTSDIAAIVGDLKQTAQSTVKSLPNAGNRKICAATVCDGAISAKTLLCCCSISMPLVHEDYTGTISSITDDAIYLKLASGQKIRILLPHLERRRCEIKPLLRGTASTGSLQSMGWSEYDTLY
ncbi:unnamed protein product [Phytophthora fragariaefolia]|uniref:Unnamed protein product n=1 Tax=Phytophthora fragariaefolia TaxID=1490495 RepID=A0A9W6XXM3_9STRA|nr:unnamed protein product [Phytophthora fragariaefolia]